MAAAKPCTPRCKYFRCGKKALRFGRGRPWCTWINEPCDPANCNYAMCVRRQLVEGGICGLTIKRRTKEDVGPEEFPMEEIRVRSKVMRKLGEKRIL